MNRNTKNNDEGRVFIFSAPSGAGKTSLVDALISTDRYLYRSISHTTRPMRNSERNGIDYHFISDKTFDFMVSKKEFVEHANVFGEKYGTAKNVLKSQLESGTDVALDIDWQGARTVKSLLPNSISVFILPPSMDALSDRLFKRGDDVTQIASRMDKARSEIEHFEEYDYLVINDNFENALIQLKTIIGASRLETRVQKIRKQRQIIELIEAKGRVC